MNHHKLLGIPMLYWMRRRLARHARMAKDFVRHQENAMTNALQVVAGSDFAQSRGLNPEMNLSDLRQALPLQSYSDFEPYINRVMQGEFRALFSEDHCPSFFATTSGTTGPVKYIPITPEGASQYQNSWLLWGMALSQYDHEFLFNRILNLTGAMRELVSPGGTPIGSITGMLAHNLSSWLKHAYLLSPGVVQIPDQDRRYYLICRMALLTGNLQMINTANPSTLLLFLRYLEQDKEHHIREIADGRLKGVDYFSSYVSPKILAPTLRANRRLARKLQKIDDQFGQLSPKEIWPDLKIIGVWTGGSLSAYLPAVREAFGDKVLLRDHGLCASEGRITIPLTLGLQSGALNFTDNFYEFIPEGQPDQIRTAEELELGQSYRVVLTNCSGLLRYDMNDVVRCEGYWHGVPTLSFQHKGSHIANITGEKLTATQVAHSLQRVFSYSINTAPEEFTLLPRYGQDGCYQLCVESEALSGDDLDKMVTTLDQELMSANVEYQAKRESGRLGPVRTQIVPKGSFAKFQRHRLLQGSGVIEQYKQPVLLASPRDVADWRDVVGHDHW